MATPQVAGAAALVSSDNPGYGANNVWKALRGNATVPDEYDEACYGHGVLDVLAALE